MPPVGLATASREKRASDGPPESPQCLYRSGRAEVWWADSRKLRPPPYDLLVTDPPYGIAWKSDRSKVSDSRPLQGDESVGAAQELLREVGESILPRLKSRRHVYVFGLSPAWRKFRWAQLVWDKGGAALGNLESPFGPSREPVFLGISKCSRAEDGRQLTRLRRGSVLRHNRITDGAGTGSTRIHPTEKPVGLLAELIECSSLPGELVLDPFAGSMATVAAAILSGRRGIGIELDRQWATAGAERIATLDAWLDNCPERMFRRR